MYNASNNIFSINVQANFVKNEEDHSSGTRSKDKLHVNNAKSHVKHISVNNQGVKLGNALEDN